MDELKELLGEELFKQIKEKLNGKKLLLDDGNMVDKKDWIPRSVYNEDKNKLRAQLEERTTDIEALKTQLADSNGQPEKLAEIQRQMTDNESKYKERDKSAKLELVETQKRFAIELALKDASCMHSELLVSKVSLDSVAEVEGKWVVHAAAIDGLKEKYKENFGTFTPHGEPSPPNDPPKPPDKLKVAELEKRHREAQEKGDTLGAVRLQRMLTEAKAK